MQQRAAMRFVGGLLSPLSQQSAVSMLWCWAAEVHPQKVTARSTQGDACLPAHRTAVKTGTVSVTNPRGGVLTSKKDRRKWTYGTSILKECWANVRACTYFLQRKRWSLSLDFSSSLRHKCKFLKMQNSLVEQASTAFSFLSICPGNKVQFHKVK